MNKVAAMCRAICKLHFALWLIGYLCTGTAAAPSYASIKILGLAYLMS